MIDKRSDGRLYSHIVMEYQHNSKKSAGHSLMAVTQDFSKSGACFFLLDEIGIGEKISFMHHPVSFQKDAVVRWVRKVQDEIYVAGMMFV